MAAGPMGWGGWGVGLLSNNCGSVNGPFMRRKNRQVDDFRSQKNKLMTNSPWTIKTPSLELELGYPLNSQIIGLMSCCNGSATLSCTLAPPS